MRSKDGDIATGNDELLADLQQVHGAREVTRETLRRFHEVSPDWRCPACCRSKAEIARLDKNGHLLCRIVSHHDHFTDFARNSLEFEAWPVVEIAFKRFPPTLMCQDCNVADVAAKRVVDAPQEFSFAPHEITYFINVARNAPHTMNRAKVHIAYSAAHTGVELLRELLDDARRWRGAEPEHISEPVSRVLAAVRTRMQRGGE
jgi:rubredoxin